MSRRLVIIATEHSSTQEAEEIFNQRGWRKVCDQSMPLQGQRSVRKDKHSTPLIELETEEYEYGVREHGRT